MKHSFVIVLSLVVGSAAFSHGDGDTRDYRGRNHGNAERSRGQGANHSRVSVGAPVHHTEVARNAHVVRTITREQRVEVAPNRYYWHNVGRTRYAHYYSHGAHWYGFYNGPRFYWSRYYANRWWWYDPGYGRWSFWWAGFWWWPGPAGVVYVYNHDTYVPYDQAGIAVAKPETVSELPDDVPLPPAVTDGTVPAANAPASMPPPVLADHSVISPDASRIIQIVGSDSEAFLYDNSTGKQVFMRHLAQKVVKARFSGGDNGQPLQILLDFQDGHFQLYDAGGEPLNSQNDQ